MSDIERICVFCGSKVGSGDEYRCQTEELGRLLARRGLGVVYGGGSVGLMGVVADAVLDAGGEVVGVIPRMLDTKELTHPGATEMHVVESMHDRKAKMLELADAFLALPGGFGTLEELMEVVSWAQLGLHAKPIGILNTAGYFDGLIAFVEHAIGQGFIKPKYRDLIVVADRPDELLDRLARHKMPAVRRWITEEES